MKIEIRKKIKQILAVVLLTNILVVGMAPMQVSAAEGSIKLSRNMISLVAGATEVVGVDYSSIPTGYADLAVVASDPAVAAVCMFDNGNGTAALAIGAIGKGTTTVAVYRTSNAAVVAYVTVRCGLAAKNQVYTEIAGDMVTTTYDDRIVQYPTILHGKNGASMVVSGIVIERERGLDKLCVSGQFVSGDSKLPGMNTFYANFYDFGGILLKRQAVYTRDPADYNVMKLEWFIPEGVATIILE